MDLPARRTARRAGPGRRTAVRVVAAAGLAVVVAELAVVALRPRDLIDPLPVEAAEHFSPAQLSAAADYRSGQRLIFWAATGVAAGTLALVAFARPWPVRSALERAASRPVLGAAAVGAGLAAGLAAVRLPFGLAAHGRSVDAGLSVQSTGAWLADQGRELALTAPVAAAGAVLLVLAIRRLPRAWWLAASGAVVVWGAAVTWLAPVVLTPIFNRVEPLPAGPLRTQVERLADRAEVEIGEVYRIDASRRSRTLNAYVGGIGPTRRVVLYDTAVEGLAGRELEAIVAHELAHQRHRDIQRGLLWLAIVAPFGLLFVREASGAIVRRAGLPPGGPAAVPAVALCLLGAGFVLESVSNQLSRSVEARADAYALELTGDPDAQIRLQRRLAAENLSEPDPPALVSFLFRTHPSTVERIGIAEAWGREASP